MTASSSDRKLFGCFAAAKIFVAFLDTDCGIERRMDDQECTAEFVGMSIGERKLEDAQRFLRTIVENAPVPIVVKEPKTQR
jgi:hypothetical protein